MRVIVDVDPSDAETMLNAFRMAERECRSLANSCRDAEILAAHYAGRPVKFTDGEAAAIETRARYARLRERLSAAIDAAR